MTDTTTVTVPEFVTMIDQGEHTLAREDEPGAGETRKMGEGGDHAALVIAPSPHSASLRAYCGRGQPAFC